MGLEEGSAFKEQLENIQSPGGHGDSALSVSPALHSKLSKLQAIGNIPRVVCDKGFCHESGVSLCSLPLGSSVRVDCAALSEFTEGLILLPALLLLRHTSSMYLCGWVHRV